MMRRHAQMPCGAQSLIRILMSNVEHCILRRSRGGIHEIHDRALVLADYSSVRLAHKVFHRRRMPVIASGHAGAVIQALLYYGPLAVRRDDKAVQVNLKAVSDCVVVDARGQTADAHQRFAIETTLVAYLSQFVWCVAREATAAPANVDTEFVRARGETALERAHHG